MSKIPPKTISRPNTLRFTFGKSFDLDMWTSLAQSRVVSDGEDISDSLSLSLSGFFAFAPFRGVIFCEQEMQILSIHSPNRSVVCALRKSTIRTYLLSLISLILSPTQVLLRLRSGFQKFDQPLMFITRGHIHRLIFIQSRLFLKVCFR